jgi:hypothetical protein
VFAFVPLSSRLVYDHLSEDEYLKLQQALIENPEAGALIPGSGGVRKLRWALRGAKANGVVFA